MTSDKGPIPYPEERALESAAVDGVTPTRLLAVLFPVWEVEIEATVTEGEPYAVIDQYVERAIAEGRITTERGLADFLCIDHTVARRAVRFLRTIGHVVDGAGGHLEVTELGLRSLREKVRYTVTVHDRRKLYFDGFASAPLTRPYYESRTVTLLDADGARAVQANRRGPRFHPFVSLTGLDPRAVTRLATNPDRDRHNLPERIDEPRATGPGAERFLPLYVVRAVGAGDRVQYLAHSQVGDGADEHLEPMVLASPIPGLLETEVEVGRAGQDEKQVREWLRQRDLGRSRPTRTRHDTWQVDLPPASFGGDGGLRLAKVGSYAMLGTGFLRLWCDSVDVRRRALLDRIDSYLGYRAQAARAEVEVQVDRIARQLELGDVDLGALAGWATSAGNRSLGAQLRRLSSGPDEEPGT